MKKSAILSLTAALALASAAANAQAPTRVRGTIAGLDGNMLTVKSRDGTDLKVKLADNFGVSAAKAITLADIKQPPIEYLRRFYYDTVGYSDPVLEYLVKVIGADRVLMGSDYCFPIAYERPVEIVTAHRALDDGQKREIVEDNARRLLKI